MNKKESYYRLAENISKICTDGMHKVFFLDTPGILHCHVTFYLSAILQGPVLVL